MTAMTYPKKGTLVASSKAPSPRPVLVTRAGKRELFHAACPCRVCSTIHKLCWQLNTHPTVMQIHIGNPVGHLNTQHKTNPQSQCQQTLPKWTDVQGKV